MPRSAAIICTRNRADALQNTLLSISKQTLSPLPLVVVVDASGGPIFQNNERAATQFSSLSIVHHRYDDQPSAARQRNVGLDLLPDSIEKVFFLDDDITLPPNCLRHLVEALESSPTLSGVGAVERSDDTNVSSTSSRSNFWKYLFLLDHPKPGRVLSSGYVSLYTALPPSAQPILTQWLSTCCCLYDRQVFSKVRFDENVPGALFEDRDLSYRIAHFADLAVVPQAWFIHHRSPVNRPDALGFARERVMQRYWFVEKNIDHPLRYVVYWWAILGKLIAFRTSKRPSSHQALHGHLQGIIEVLKQHTSLLQ